MQGWYVKRLLFCVFFFFYYQGSLFSRCFCCLSYSNLSSNHLSRLEESSFVGLSLLDELHIGNNRVSFIADGAFRGLSNLQMLWVGFKNPTHKSLCKTVKPLKKKKTDLSTSNLYDKNMKSFLGQVSKCWYLIHAAIASISQKLRFTLRNTSNVDLFVITVIIIVTNNCFQFLC